MGRLKATDILTLCRAATIGLDGIWNGHSWYKFAGVSAAAVNRLIEAAYPRGEKTRQQNLCCTLTKAGWLEIAEWLEDYYCWNRDMLAEEDAVRPDSRLREGRQCQKEGE